MIPVVRRLLLGLMLAVTVAFLAPAAPAQAQTAGQEMRICFVVGYFNDRPIFDCITIMIPELKPHPPGPDWCPACLPGVQFGDNLDPEIRQNYLDKLGQGLALLGKAATTDNPDLVKEYRLMATDSFLASAEILGKSNVELDRVGWADPEYNKFDEDQTSGPLLEMGQQLAEGLGLMQVALGDPTPQPNINAAMECFDKAYADFDALYVD